MSVPGAGRSGVQAREGGASSLWGDAGKAPVIGSPAGLAGVAGKVERPGDVIQVTVTCRIWVSKVKKA